MDNIQFYSADDKANVELYKHQNGAFELLYNEEISPLIATDKLVWNIDGSIIPRAKTGTRGASLSRESINLGVSHFGRFYLPPKDVWVDQYVINALLLTKKESDILYNLSRRPTFINGLPKAVWYKLCLFKYGLKLVPKNDPVVNIPFNYTYELWHYRLFEFENEVSCQGKLIKVFN